MECDTPLESFLGELQVRFRPHPSPRFEPGVELPKSREFKSGQFQDSSLGVLGIKAIWMRVRWSNAENIIWGKVVASPEFGPW